MDSANTPGSREHMQNRDAARAPAWVYVAEISGQAPPGLEDLCLLSWGVDLLEKTEATRALTPVPVRILHAYRVHGAERLWAGLTERFRDRQVRGRWHEFTLEDLDELAEAAARWLRRHADEAERFPAPAVTAFDAERLQPRLSTAAFSLLHLISRRQGEPMSYSFICERMGVSSRTTVSRAVKELRAGIGDGALVEAERTGPGPYRYYLSRHAQ